MDLILSKFIPLLLLPLGLSLVILTAALLYLWRPGIRWEVTRPSVVLMFACLLILWLGGSPFFADRLFSFLEGRHVSKEAKAYPAADVIVVLGGGVAGEQAGGRKVLPGRAFDRLYLGYCLYRAKKAPRVLLSGGNIDWRRRPGSLPEAQLMAALLKQLGLPEEALLIESYSRNTRGNAWFTREIVSGKKREPTVLLVTSAFHMTRARACFEKLGLNVIACPADFRVDPYSRVTLLDFLPDAGALDNATIALREYIGLVYYRLRGWI